MIFEWIKTSERQGGICGARKDKLKAFETESLLTL